jgi:hypothetical protein
MTTNADALTIQAGNFRHTIASRIGREYPVFPVFVASGPAGPNSQIADMGHRVHAA